MGFRFCLLARALALGAVLTLISPAQAQPGQRAIALYRSPAAALAGGTYEYMLVPFHHENFPDRESFEASLDEIGAESWISIAHFPALTPSGHQRLFMREVGSPVQVDFEIDRYPFEPGGGVNEWLPVFDEIGEEGKFPIWFFSEGRRQYVVTEVRTIDGVLQTLSWQMELAGQNFDRDRARFENAAEVLADDAYVPNTIGLSDDESQYFEVGLKNTAPGGEITVDLKFGDAQISTSPRKWKRLVNKKAKKGFRLVQVELADNTGGNFVLVFAKVMVDGMKTKQKCIVEPILLDNLPQMVENLNLRGAEGYEEILVTFAGSFDAFQFVLCRDK